jgi:hypothetical protein
MSLDLCASTRAWVARSASRRELGDFAHWLEGERYSSFVADQHLRRMAFMLERLAPDGRRRVYSARQLECAFARECSPRSRLFRFAGSRRAYSRYLRAKARLRVEPDVGRYAADHALRGGASVHRGASGWATPASTPPCATLGRIWISSAKPFRRCFRTLSPHLVGVGCSSTARIWSVGSGGSRRICAGGHLLGLAGAGVTC